MEEGTKSVQVSQGLLQGRKTTTKSGGPLLSFQGIPYAKPPIGPLRFMPPHPPDPWSGIYKAQTEPPVSPQNENGVFLGQDDCLYLNVYTAEIKSGTLKPVMFWIHGGGFVVGSGNTDLYGPDYLVDAGVVVVTFNYRLGVIGFLGLDNGEFSGNMGLKDQVAALCWVKLNIASFGGDPENITIFGESAGGVCVSYHMVSPMTKDLFHKAIAQSGSALNPWGFTREIRYRTFRLGELLGLKTTDEKELMNFLRSVEAEQLVKASEHILARIENTSGLKIVFVPTVEPVVPGQKAYLTEHPSTLYKSGKFHHVPYITGTVTHEGMVNLRDILKNPSILNTLNESFENVIPRLYRLGKTKSEIDEMNRKIKKFYLKNAPLSMETIDSYLNLHTDLQMATGINTVAKNIAHSSPCPVYFYNFAFDGELGCAKKVMGQRASEFEGSVHGDDLGYLFRLGVYDPELDPECAEVRVREQMVTLWTNFAKSGNPTPHITKQIPIQWLPFTETQQQYLVIDEELRIDSHLRRERMAFWEDFHHYCKL